MLNGLDLFSGIGGLTAALLPWVRPVAYCENERYAQAVLLSHMSRGLLPIAPIWDDVRTLRGERLPAIDIIAGGFPCQDISVAGLGAGLEGERSGLVFEVFRLAKELTPSFIFLENVPRIRTLGGERVVKELAALGYDCRWDVLSAYDVGAPHKRERWFLLAYRDSDGRQVEPQRHGQEPEGGRSFWNDIDRLCDTISNASSFFVRHKQRRGGGTGWPGPAVARNHGASQPVADANGQRQRPGAGVPEQAGESQAPVGGGGESLADTPDDGAGRRIEQPARGAGAGHVADSASERWGEGRSEPARLEGGLELAGSGETVGDADSEGLEEWEPWNTGECPTALGASWWFVEPDVGRVAHGVQVRVDRIRGLGNAVVPAQAREAFRRLMGLNP